MRNIIESIEAEYRRYKALAESAMKQLSDSQLNEQGQATDNSIAIITRHVGGNLRSRFTNFMTEDGEKSWRNRDQEFSSEFQSRADLLSEWELGWQVLFDSLSSLKDENLSSIVKVRGAELKVHEALHRSLGHTCYHVGQIVYIAKNFAGSEWSHVFI